MPDMSLKNISPLFVRALAGCLALAIAMGIGRFAFTPILPMILAEGALSIRQGTWLASANYAGYLAGALVLPALGMTAETAVRAGLAIVGVTTLAMALDLPIEVWSAIRVFGGIGSAWVLIAISAWSLGAFPGTSRARFSGIVFAGVGTGIAAAGLWCLLVLHQQGTSAQAWLLLGVLASAGALLVWPVYAAGSCASRQPRALRATIRWRMPNTTLAVCYGIFGFGYIIPATFLPVLAREALGDSGWFGWAWPLFGLAAAVSTLLVAPAARFFSSTQLLAGSYLVMAVGIGLPAFQLNIATIIVAALCVGGTFMVITFIAIQEARRIDGDHAPALIAAMTAAFATGQIVGPLTVGVSARVGFSEAMLFASALLAGGGCALGAVLRTDRRD